MLEDLVACVWRSLQGVSAAPQKGNSARPWGHGTTASSMSTRRHEFLSPEGLRVDGRRAAEARLLRCRLGTQADADGSAYVRADRFAPHVPRH
jgi:hypothetical protein